MMVNIRLWVMVFALVIAIATSLVFVADCSAADSSIRSNSPYQRPVLRKQYPTMARGVERIQFEAGESLLTPAAINILDRQVASIRAQPKAPVTIYGFADAEEGEAQVVERLARRRAETVRDYLLAKSLNLYRLKLETILPSAGYAPPLASGWPRPTRYTLTQLSPWDE
ncbi:OmpA family protein [Ferrovibrio terrae]|uniref:OmpA family protein n=1 Tax=Ferrovibrio terrae TaxID=2594003 RepID=A0A516H4K3_9PROT|nr:OmpA family protein [Ferrovibrio terrae]QDO98698.1 OmpA family protein [Ferrovibrio terrae]